MPNVYNLTEIPPGVRIMAAGAHHDGDFSRPLWSGAEAIPKVGDRVFICMNGFGLSTVTGYFVEHGYFGIMARPDKRPDWHVKQEPKRDVCCFFGIDIRKGG